MYTAKQKQTCGNRKQTSGYQWAEGRDERQDKSIGLGNTSFCV